MNRQEIHERAGVTGAVMVLPRGSTWQVVGAPPTELPHLLSGVTAASSTEIWVVGNASHQPLIASWDGSGWSIPPGPEPEAALLGAGLQGIAVGLNDTVGAVAVGGGYDRLAEAEVPIIRHWNGSAWKAWDNWDSPEFARGFVLTDVVALGDGHAWAVGHGFPWNDPRGPGGPISLHMNGGGWEPAAVPQVINGKLLAVAGTTPDDVWAVGAERRTGMIMHYDGLAWTRVAIPSTSFPLTDVVALSPTDAWAVGRDRVLRWNGRKWNRVKVPVKGANTVTALGPHEVWVAGGRGEIAHFDGHRWRLETPPQPLGDSAVWLASAPLPGAGRGVCLVGSHQLAHADAVGNTSSISAQSKDN